jgi:hypothetical protein
MARTKRIELQGGIDFDGEPLENVIQRMIDMQTHWSNEYRNLKIEYSYDYDGILDLALTGEIPESPEQKAKRIAKEKEKEAKKEAKEKKLYEELRAKYGEA